MEPWMQYFAGGAAALGGFIGAAKLFHLYVIRHWKRKDAKEDAVENLHVTVESKKIDQDSAAFDHVIKRLEKVEDQLQEVQGKLSQEMADNSRCQAEADALRKDNDRQQGEIERLRTRVHDLADKLQTRDGQLLSFQHSLDASNKALEVLRNELTETTKELNKLKNGK